MRCGRGCAPRLGPADTGRAGISRIYSATGSATVPRPHATAPSAPRAARRQSRPSRNDRNKEAMPRERPTWASASTGLTTLEGTALLCNRFPAQGMDQNLAHDARQRLATDVGKRHPARASRRRRACRKLGGIDEKLERKMREYVAYRTRQPPPRHPLQPDPPLRFSRRQARRAVERLGFVEIRRPAGRGNFGHAAEETLRRARAHEHKAVGATGDEGGAAAQRAFALAHPPRKGLGVAARARGAAIIPRT